MNVVQGCILKEAVAFGPHFFRDAMSPFESFALSFCIVLNLVHKSKCEKQISFFIHLFPHLNFAVAMFWGLSRKFVSKCYNFPVFNQNVF